MAVRPIDLLFQDEVRTAMGQGGMYPRATYGSVSPLTQSKPISITIDRGNVIPETKPQQNVMTEPNMSGLLGSTLYDPATAGLLGASANILQQSGYSTMPKTTGQILGSGIDAGLQNFQTALKNNRSLSGRNIQVVGGALIDYTNPSDPKVLYETPTKMNKKVTFNKDTGQVVDYTDPNNPLVTNVPNYKVPPNKSQSSLSKEIDKKFAKEYNDFVIGGQSQTAQKNIRQLEDAIRILEETNAQGIPLTGTWKSAMPDSLNAYINPEGVKVQEMVLEVVQSNLRSALGSAFTEREATQLLNRAFNDKLSPEENIRRIKALQQAIKLTYQQKIKAIEFYEKNGTLEGFQGSKLLKINDVSNTFDTLVKPNQKLKIQRVN